MLMYFRLNEDVKNCLKDGGNSLLFLVLNTLYETFKCTKFVAQPLSKAPKIYYEINYNRLIRCNYYTIFLVVHISLFVSIFAMITRIKN